MTIKFLTKRVIIPSGSCFHTIALEVGVTMKEDNQVKSNSLVFEYLGIISFVATAFVCAWSHVLFKVLFSEQYLSGYIVAPYLFLAPLLQMLFQVACNQFIVIKKTWPNMLILSAGAVVNIFINLALIPVLGIEGAALATLLGDIVSDIVCVIVLCKMKLMIVSKKFIVSCLGIVIYLLLWRTLFSTELLSATALSSFLVVVYIVLYKNEFVFMINGIKRKIQKPKGSL